LRVKGKRGYTENGVIVKKKKTQQVCVYLKR